MDTEHSRNSELTKLEALMYRCCSGLAQGHSVLLQGVCVLPSHSKRSIAKRFWLHIEKVTLMTGRVLREILGLSRANRKSVIFLLALA